MQKYEFILTFSLPNAGDNPEMFLDALYDAGCDDASVGIGRHGLIGLDFTREAPSAEDALRSAIKNVRSAIPGAVLVQAGPDLVGLTEMAEIFEFTRQNMRKYTLNGTGRKPFPNPVILGEPSLWHLAEIARWLKLNTSVSPPPEIIEISRAAAKVNLEVAQERLGGILEPA